MLLVWGHIKDHIAAKFFSRCFVSFSLDLSAKRQPQRIKRCGCRPNSFATDVTFTEKYEGSTDGMVQVSTHAARGFIPMMELIDRDKELARLNKEKAKAEKEMAMFANQLNNPKFVERAPAALVEDIRNKYAKSQDKLANIEQSIKALG